MSANEMCRERSITGCGGYSIERIGGSGKENADEGKPSQNVDERAGSWRGRIFAESG